MKRWIRLIVVILFVGLLFPNVLSSKVSALDDVKGDNHFVNSFAAKDGSNYYVNRGHLEDMTLGIYKVSNDMKKFRLIKQGNYTNIQLYKNTMVIFNDDVNKLQRFSFDGTLVREYPQVTSSNFLIDRDRIYYHTGRNVFEININGQGNKHLYTSEGTIQEFSVHNGWLYYTYLIPTVPQPYDYSMSFARFKISTPQQVVPIISKVSNIDSLIVRDGYIYSVIHQTSTMNGRYLYRMNYSGDFLQRISTVDTTALFIGTKYVYFVDNTGTYRQYFYRMDKDGKNAVKVGDLTGSKLSAEYHNAAFYFEIQNVQQDTFYLRRILQTR
ncbi:DUF5050 domain-containing protein [Sporosarcina sp. P17b]|uniref:DUF5050 domain-containing protein n=1 Tax=Sporosarcina sp. P17b TaxID=2048260 RepID=UPI000C162C9F|nr:DUF5050 domain-containing protein [Sporosarcina sp. P17b]PIC73913.1 hypothetical protein CSV76_08365 [Sporosarcina sp. P17b]